MHKFATKICLWQLYFTFLILAPIWLIFKPNFETFSVILRKMGVFLSHQMIRTFLKTFFIVSYFDNAMLCNQFHQLLHQIAPQNWCDCAEKLEKRRRFAILGLHCDIFFLRLLQLQEHVFFKKFQHHYYVMLVLLQKSMRCWKDVLIKPLLKWPPQILNPLNLIYTSYVISTTIINFFITL